MKKFFKEILNNLVDRYRKDKNVLGIMLTGSLARNRFDRYSDIDIYILLGKKKKISRQNFLKNGIRVDIIFDTPKEAYLYLKQDRYNLKRVTSHLLANGKILYQKGSILSKIQKMAINNLTLRTKYKKDEILMHKYSIDDFWGEVQRDIEKKNYLALGIDSQLLINNILELFLKLKGKYLKQPNKIIKTLEKLDKNFANKLGDFYKTEKLSLKKRILGELVDYTKKKMGGLLPPNWSIK